MAAQDGYGEKQGAQPLGYYGQPQQQPGQNPPPYAGYANYPQGPPPDAYGQQQYPVVTQPSAYSYPPPAPPGFNAYGGNPVGALSHGQGSTNSFDPLNPKDHGGILKNRPVWNDVWATIFYVIHVIVFFAICAWGAQIMYVHISTHNATEIYNRTTTPRPTTPTPIRTSPAFPQGPTTTTKKPKPLFSSNISFVDPQSTDMMARTLPTTVGIAVLLTVIYIFTAYSFTRAFIIASWWLYVVVYLSGSGGMFYLYAKGGSAGALILGILFAVFGLLFALFYCCWRSRIPLATIMLQSTMWVIHLHPAMLFAGVLSLLVQTVVTICWLVGLIGMSLKFEDNGPRIAVTVYLMFSFFWSSQVIKNVGHCTSSGVYATFYFLEGSGTTVSNPVSESGKRALTYSFGSVCFGSLLIAIIQTVRWLLRMAGRRGFIGAFIDCILACIEDLAKYFNHYAYTQVAIYGKSFIRAAKDTWHLVKDRGFDAIINDNLIGSVLGMGQLFVALVCAVLAWVIATKANTVNLDNGLDIILAVIAGFFGFMIMGIVSGIIESGTATIFVCLAEDPAALRRSKPDLYQKFVEVYPTVLYQAGSGSGGGYVAA